MRSITFPNNSRWPVITGLKLFPNLYVDHKGMILKDNRPYCKIGSDLSQHIISDICNGNREVIYVAYQAVE